MRTLQALCGLILWRVVNIDSAEDAKGRLVPLEVSNESSEEQDDLVRNRRSGGDDKWPWDLWCQLQPVLGNKDSEEKSTKRFYYDRQIDECRPYNYTSARNKNSFLIKENCERYCSKSAYALINYMDEKSRLTCALQYDAGLCFTVPGVKSSILWYFDINEKQCKNFTHSGCGGNHNRWNTQFQCWKFCGKAEIPMLRVKNGIHKEINSTPEQETGVLSSNKQVNGTINTEKEAPSTNKNINGTINAEKEAPTTNKQINGTSYEEFRENARKSQASKKLGQRKKGETKFPLKQERKPKKESPAKLDAAVKNNDDYSEDILYDIDNYEEKLIYNIK